MSFSNAWLDLHKQKELVGALKYVGILITTGLSIYTLRQETVVKSGDPMKPNKFTHAGKLYLAGLLGAACLTIITSYWENRISEHIEQEAKQAGYRELFKLFEPMLREQRVQVEKGLQNFEVTMNASSGELKKNLIITAEELQSKIKEVTNEAEHLRINERDQSFSSNSITGYAVYMCDPESRANPVTAYPAETYELHRAARVACAMTFGMGVEIRNPEFACIHAHSSLLDLQYGAPLAGNLGVTETTSIEIDLALRNTKVMGRSGVCEQQKEDLFHCTMSFSMTYPDNSNTVSLLLAQKVAFLGPPTEASVPGYVEPELRTPTNQNLPVGFSISGLRLDSAAKMYGRDTDFVSLSIRVCGGNAPAQKHWNVKIRNWSQFPFDKDYHLFLTKEHVVTGCYVRDYAY